MLNKCSTSTVLNELSVTPVLETFVYSPLQERKTTERLHAALRLAGSHHHALLLVTSPNLPRRDQHPAWPRPQFAPVAGQVTVNTLNAYGYRQIREKVRSPKLLISPADLHFAMLNQLRNIWLDFPHIADVVQGRRSGARRLMDVMDNVKSMGFDHTVHTNRARFQERLDALNAQGLAWKIAEQFEILTSIGVLESTRQAPEAPSASPRYFYDKFFIFWRKASAVLHQQATFTFEDQKYWAYLDLRSPGTAGKRKPFITGAARYDHVFVDEFQDINPLDLALIKLIVERNQANLTIVGDDDQAIFEWRGASPEYILHPAQYFGVPFEDCQLTINYRSPRQIVALSQNLDSRNNENADASPSIVNPLTMPQMPP